eukprot:jgi/Psemu1/31833/gm1.31833_g
MTGSSLIRSHDQDIALDMPIATQSFKTGSILFRVVIHPWRPHRCENGIPKEFIHVQHPSCRQNAKQVLRIPNTPTRKRRNHFSPAHNRHGTRSTEQSNPR